MFTVNGFNFDSAADYIKALEEQIEAFHELVHKEDLQEDLLYHLVNNDRPTMNIGEAMLEDCYLEVTIKKRERDDVVEIQAAQPKDLI